VERARDNGQFRFTPPTHALVAFHQAMKEHAQEGGVAARGARYQKNAQILIKGMRDMGFSTLLSTTMRRAPSSRPS
jgi:2-aminoethylphosphonate-pyruvate transaminase